MDHYFLQKLESLCSSEESWVESLGNYVKKESRANIVQISDDIFEDTEIKVSSWPELKKNYWVHDDTQKEITSLN